MTIYVSHSRHHDFDYKAELYIPLEQSKLANFIFPHATDAYVDAKKLFSDHGCDMVLAECSFSATGQGIELGWASMMNIPIICAYKTGSDVSGSAKSISQYQLKYRNSDDLIVQLKTYLNQYHPCIPS